jgi:hypothetical protein
MNRSVGNNVSANLAPTFTDDTASKTGMSERAIDRAVRRGDRIAPDVLKAVVGTALDGTKSAIGVFSRPSDLLS